METSPKHTVTALKAEFINEVMNEYLFCVVRD